jgi:hypothetical protein
LFRRCGDAKRCRWQIGTIGLLPPRHWTRARLANAFTRHAGMPVEAGMKHVVTKWFRERAWVKTDRTDSYRS